MSFNVTILGSNSALPTSERYPTAQVLNVSERFFLIDCGEGTQSQMRKMGIRFTKINHIFISHLHGDHVFGLIGFISTLGLLGRNIDLHVFSHPDLETLLKPHLDYYCHELPFQVVFHPLTKRRKEIVFEDDKVMVYAIPLRHRIETFGFLFVEKLPLPNIRKELIDEYQLSIAEIVKIKNGADLKLEDGTIVPNSELIQPQRPARSYAFCSDTSFFKGLAKLIEGVDLLYHESTFTQEHAKLAKKTGHSTAKQAAEIAVLSGAKKLILGHFSSRNKDLQVYLDEALLVFPHAELALEGSVFEV